MQSDSQMGISYDLFSGNSEGLIMSDVFAKIKEECEKAKQRQRTPEQRLEDEKQRVEMFNSAKGNLEGYDCKKCNNKGAISFLYNGLAMESSCECISIRDSLRRIEESGLEELLEDYTFDKYIIKSEWQKTIKDRALSFLENIEKYGWFFIGGQVGCGKTHICTAITSELLKRGMSVKYMLWRDEIVPIKANVNNDMEYERLIKPLKTVQVLYIDDLFKTRKGYKQTAGDINVAFEILNYRYNQRNLITMISSEKTIEELIDIDEGIGSRIDVKCRIGEKSTKYLLNITRDIERNFRLRGSKV